MFADIRAYVSFRQSLQSLSEAGVCYDVTNYTLARTHARKQDGGRFVVQTICVKTDGYAKYDGYNGQDYQDRPWNVCLPLTTKWMRALRRGTWNVYRRAKTRRIEQHQGNGSTRSTQ